MAVYPLQELKNRITDRIHEQHERAIDGPDLQEMLHDVVDSLDAVLSPANEMVKNFPLVAVTGSQTIVVTGYQDKFRILDICITLTQGIAGFIRAGLAPGGDDVLMDMDLSGLTAGSSLSIYCGKMFAVGQDTLYLSLDGTGELFDVSLTLIRFKT